MLNWDAEVDVEVNVDAVVDLVRGDNVNIDVRVSGET